MACKVPYPKSKLQPAWRLVYKLHTGKNKFVVFHGTTKQADQALFYLQNQEDMIRFGMKPRQDISLSYDDALYEYFTYLKSENRSPATIERYKRSLKAFSNYLGKRYTVNMIDTRIVVRFKIMRSKTLTLSGVNIDLRHIKAFINFCDMMGYLTVNPFKGIKISEVYIPPRFFNDKEISTLLNMTKSDRMANDLILFYLNTAARANEILPPQFTWDNIVDGEIKLIGKRSKIRFVPINQPIKIILNSRQDLPFPFPYTYNDVYHKIVRYWYKKCKITNANIHTLRKTTGALMVRQGIDIYRVSKFLGHSSVTVTERHYVDLLRQDYCQPSNDLAYAITTLAQNN